MNKKNIIIWISILFLLPAIADATTLMLATFDDAKGNMLSINDGESFGYSIYAYSILEPSMTVIVDLINSTGHVKNLAVYSNVVQTTYMKHYTLTKQIYEMPGAYTIRATARGATGFMNSSYLQFKVIAVAETNNPSAFTSTPITEMNEGDIFYYQAIAQDPEGSAMNYHLSQAPSWISINSLTGLVSGTAPQILSDYNYAITILASDGTYNITQTFPLAVKNKDVQSSNVNSLLSFDTLNGRNCTLIDGSSIAFTAHASCSLESSMIVRISLLDSENKTIAVLGTVLLTNNTFSYNYNITPEIYPGPGNYTILGTVTGISGKTSSSALSLQVILDEDYYQQNNTNSTNNLNDTNNTQNSPPMITSAPATAVFQGEAYSYQVTAIDADEDQMTFLLIGPAWLSIGASNGLVSGTAPILYQDSNETVKIIISDGKSQPVMQEYSVETVYVPDGAVMASLQFNATQARSMQILDTGSATIKASAYSTYETNMTISMDLFDAEGNFIKNIIQNFTTSDVFSETIDITNQTCQGIGNYTIREFVFGGRGSNDSAILLLEVIANATNTMTNSSNSTYNNTNITGNYTDTTNTTGNTTGNMTTNTTNMTNHPPILMNIPDITVNETGVIQVFPDASDPDNDSIIIIYTSPLNSTGGWATNHGDSGNYTATIILNDLRGGITSQAISIFVLRINTPPELSPVGEMTVYENSTISFGLEASDEDNDAIVITAIDIPQNSNIQDLGNGSAIVTFTPSFSQAGIYNMTFRASDGQADTTTSVMVEVIDVDIEMNETEIGDNDDNQSMNVTINNTLTNTSQNNTGNFSQNNTINNSINSTQGITYANIYGISIIEIASGDAENATGVIIDDSTTIRYANITNQTLPRIARITSSNIEYSLMTDVSEINNCTSIGTNETYNLLIGTSCVNQYIDPSIIIWSNITGTTPIINSTIAYSNITYSSSDNSIVNNSQISRSRIKDSLLDYVSITNMNITNSSIRNATVSDMNILNGNLTDGMIYPWSVVTIGNKTMIVEEAHNISEYINHPPIAAFETPTGITSGNMAAFNETSHDLDMYGFLNDSIAYKRWDYGDGSSGNLSNHTYSSAGTYNVTLTVFDQYGASNSTRKTIAIGTNIVINLNTGTGGTSTSGESSSYTSYTYDSYATSKKNTTAITELSSKGVAFTQAFIKSVCLGKGETVSFMIGNGELHGFTLIAVIESDIARLKSDRNNYYDIQDGTSMDLNIDAIRYNDVRLLPEGIGEEKACFSIFELKEQAKETVLPKPSFSTATAQPSAVAKPALPPQNIGEAIQSSGEESITAQSGGQSDNSEKAGLLGLTGKSVLGLGLGGSLWKGMLIIIMTASVIVFAYIFSVKRNTSKYQF